MRARRPAELALAFALAFAGMPADARSPDPKVPPGRDPGGPAVAIVGGGLDYRRPEIARRLARDGEGELIGWDFAGNDARPFSEAAGNDRLADVVSAEGQAARLVVVRVAAGRDDQIAMALRFAADTPARLIVIAADPGSPLPRAVLADAARHLDRYLIVVAARLVASDPVATPGGSEQAGLLIVGAEGSAAPADLIVSLTAQAGSAVESAIASGLVADDIAAARVAALASRLTAREPELAGAALRARILSLTRPEPTGPPVIRDIGRLHWLE